MSFEKIIEKVTEYNPGANLDLLRKAYALSEEAHKDQWRISGENFIVHPVAVVQILAELELDMETLIAGFLHDVVEDTGISLEVIEKEFGREVAEIVDGVTKLGRIEYKSKEEQQVENLRKMFLAMAKDIRVILIKLADRLHNMRTLEFQPEFKRKEIANETLEIFAPLAHRLGIYHLKWELEDLSFCFLEPGKYYELAERINKTRNKREEYIQQAITLLKEKLVTVDIKADIQGRPKHIYSIHEKMLRQQKDLSEIYDVMAVRVLVNSVRDCYAALGIIHTLWKPIPGRFKDYIAMPKSNMYQSLHTSVIGPQGEPLEIQVRTMEMHYTAEYGIAAHWRYKEESKADNEFEQKLAWLRRILEWQHDLRDAREFMESLKIDLFDDVVFVFSPKGDVFELPAGSVPLDFAYRIHTDIGHRCIGAKVNGRLVPLDYSLKNGDIIEITTSKQQSYAPSRDWLGLVKTSTAKTKIRQWFRKEQREGNILRGREFFEREVKKQGLDLEFFKGEKIAKLGRRYNLTSVEDVYAAMGDGTITPQGVVSHLKEENQVEKKGLVAEESLKIKSAGIKSRTDWNEASRSIKVKGMENLLVRLAHCCNPIPGDPVIGYVTRGRGISIHRMDCRNVSFYWQMESERIMEATWDKDFHFPFQVKLEISAMDRTGLLSDVMAILTEMKISANWVTARGKKNRMATIEMLLEVKELEQLNYLINKINRVKDVFEVRRTSFGGIKDTNEKPSLKVHNKHF